MHMQSTGICFVMMIKYYFQEFKFLRPTMSPSKYSLNGSKHSAKSGTVTPPTRNHHFEEHQGQSTPFDLQTDTDDKEDVFAGGEVTLY